MAEDSRKEWVRVWTSVPRTGNQMDNSIRWLEGLAASRGREYQRENGMGPIQHRQTCEFWDGEVRLVWWVKGL